MKRSAISLLIILSLLSCSSERPEEKYTALVRKAEEYEASQNLEEARITLLNAANAMPENPDAYIRLGNIYSKLGRLPDVASSYMTVLELDPKNVQGLLYLSAIQLAAKNTELAESQINKVLEIDPKNREALILKSNIDRAAGRKDAAKKVVEDILAEDPNYSLALANMGSIALEEGNLNEAEKYLSAAAKADPENGPIQLTLADIYFRQDKVDLAEEVPKGATAQKPDNAGLRSYFAEFLLRKGDSNKAHDEFMAAIKADPERHQTRDRLFDIMIAQGQRDQAIELAKDLEKQSPKSNGIPYFSARVAELNNNLEDVLKLYEQSILSMPGFNPGLRRIGLVELRLGKTSVGVEHLNQAVASNPQDVSARMGLARYYMVQRDFSSARQHVDAVLAYIPRHVGANVIMADLMLVEGKLDEARELYEVLIDAYPNNPTGYLKMALLEQKSGNSSKAEELYIKASSFKETALFAFQKLASFYRQTSKPTETVKKLAKVRQKSLVTDAQYNLIIGLIMLSHPDPDGRVGEQIRSLLVEALEQDPDLSPAYLVLAQLDARQKNQPALIENYKNFLEKNPNHVQTRMMLAIALENAMRFQDAETEYRAILKISPKFAPACSNLAWLISEHLNGNLDEALALAQVAKEGIPQDASISDTLGWINFKMGSKGLALSILEESVSLAEKSSPNSIVNPEILYHLAVVRASLGYDDEAKKLLVEIQKHLPNESALSIKVKDSLADIDKRTSERN